MAKIDLIIDHTKKWEGGLSNASTDTASKDASPYIYKGVYGWHTNRGITYTAFKNGAETLGYKDTADNFLKMPDDIWLKIAKVKYWDTLDLDSLDSQAIANLLFSWTWAGGSGYKKRISSYLKSKGIEWNDKKPAELTAAINLLIKKIGEQKVFIDLMDQYKSFYKGMPEKSNPKTEKHPEGIYTKGWLNRLEDLKTFSTNFLGKTAKKAIPIALILALAVGAYFFFKRK